MKPIDTETGKFIQNETGVIGNSLWCFPPAFQTKAGKVNSDHIEVPGKGICLCCLLGTPSQKTVY